MENITTLEALLDWCIRFLAMYLAFEITKRIAWPPDSEMRRYFSFLVAVILGLIAWGVGIEFGYIAKPIADWHAWVESATAIALTIIVGEQVVHARVVLSQRPPAC
jgi:hypothetical protein